MKWILLILASSFSAFGYFSTIDTGTVTETGKYRLIFSPQAILSDGSGINATTHMDTGLSEATGIRVTVGAGSTDFHTGLAFKYIPIPDIDNQPAIGFRTGVIWGRDEGETIISARFHPIISKKFDNRWGEFDAYASLPLGITAFEEDSAVPVHFVVGSEWKTYNFHNLTFGAELGLNVDDAFSYINGFVALYFDDDEPITIEKR